MLQAAKRAGAIVHWSAPSDRRSGNESRTLVPAEQPMARLDDRSERSDPSGDPRDRQGKTRSPAARVLATHHLQVTHVTLRGPSRDDGLVMAFAWVAISAATSASMS